MSPCRLKMTKFRLKLDMSQFYDDERNLVYIMVDPKWKQVLSLQEHVEKLFGVSTVHFLTYDGVYIPPRESIDIIRSKRVLRVISLQKMGKEKKKKSKTRIYDGFGDEVASEEVMKILGEKSKFDDDKLTHSKPHPRPSKMQKTSVNHTIIEQPKTEDNSEQNTFTNILSPRTQQSSTTSNAANMTQQNDSKVMEQDSMQAKTKTKPRKRKRARKWHKQESVCTRLSCVPPPISSSTLNSAQTMDTSNRTVNVDEVPTPMEHSGYQPKNDRVVYRCRLNTDEVLVPRETNVEDATILPHTSTILIHDDDSLHNNDSVVIEIGDNIVRSEPENMGDVTESIATENFSKVFTSVSIEEILSLTEPLLGLPLIGEIILFKLHRLDKHFRPIVSDYICGRCEELDSTKRTMHCLVLDGLDQIDARCPRFTPSEAEDLSRIDGTLNCVVLFLDELVDKRIFKMS